jgi:uncharacterized protein
VDQHELLHRLFGTVVIPPAVAAELAQGALTRSEINRVLHAEWLEVRTLNDLNQADRLAQILERGEAEALVLALELNCALLIDDLPGRRCALSMNVKITGTLGVLVAAKTRGMIPLVRPVIQRMIQDDGFRVSQALLAETLKEVGE